ncbi:ADP-glyceromanno-heptose 6-epimerase [Aestuariivirga sp. YIM B02566]|uniref:ADP-glyceromanno-heptose 6-epimerase n=1 Tax=Taklimakanibacter albus TaxID=2800327 RepID=A0ACC5R783_9HYPH|nr:ADP-glyceromanno-heptose 6-epimerase [Aestuariivirga sp. YIM B02566]MBK1868534.1 ADP-glyceromanno-heptose 6-epimerase [Aestuariivirga sp. YIM B02566]
MIIVTGGAGFIGSNLVHALNDTGHDDILIVDDLTDARKHLNLSGARFTDYMDKDELPSRFASLGKVDAVFHQGACAVTTEQDGRYMMRVNYTYSRDLLHQCLGTKVPFIYASSAAVYGHGSTPFTEAPAHEKPLNVYGFSKLTFDQHVRALLAKAESPVTGLRYFNVYGPRENHKGDMASVIFKMVDAHARGEPLKLFSGSERFRRDFIHVDDIAAVNLHFLRRPLSGIYNCGTGVARSFRDLGEAVQGQLPGATIKEIEMPPSLERQYQKFTCSDNSRLLATGYNAQFLSLEAGVAKYVAKLTQPN